MQCDCRTRVEANILEHFKAQNPDATDHKVELKGYGITIGEKKLDLRAGMPAATSCMRTAKTTGRVSEKKSEITMFFPFCPFCGKPAEAPEEAQG